MRRKRLTVALVGGATAVATVVGIAVATSGDKVSDGNRAQRSGLIDLRRVRVSEEYMDLLRECRTPRSVVLIPRARPGYCDVLEHRGVHPDARRLPDED